MSSTNGAGSAAYRMNGEHTGRKENTRPSSKHARPLDPDLLPWERQPDESSKAYNKFVEYRDSEERRVTAHGPSALGWSSAWSWGYRAYEYDRYLANAALEDMVRHRVKMNERQRRAAVAAQQKVIQWLMQLDPTKMTTTEAARWFEIAVRVERAAVGSDQPEEVLVVARREPLGSLGDILNEIDEDEVHRLARELHRIMPNGKPQAAEQ